MSSMRKTGSDETWSGTVANAPIALRACWTRFCMSFWGAVSRSFTSAERYGSPRLSASRRAKPGTSSGLRRDGTAVTQVGNGSARRSVSIISTTAATSSSANLSSVYLPALTRWPHPASPYRASARPSRSLLGPGMVPVRSPSPGGHALSGSIGRYARRRNRNASSNDGRVHMRQTNGRGAVRASTAPLVDGVVELAREKRHQAAIRRHIRAHPVLLSASRCGYSRHPYRVGLPSIGGSDPLSVVARDGTVDLKNLQSALDVACVAFTRASRSIIAHRPIRRRTQGQHAGCPLAGNAPSMK